jgi:phosphomannomutase
MPQVSRFFGIVIAMYHDDHQPPHFHARYGGQEIQVGISDGRVKGDFPPRAKALVLEWWNLRREELEANWQLLADGKESNRIAPLE